MIYFACVCGTELTALDGQAGRRMLCPSCRSDLVVPAVSFVPPAWLVPDLRVVVQDGPLVKQRNALRTPSRDHSPLNMVGLFGLMFVVLSTLPIGVGLFLILDRWFSWTQMTHEPGIMLLPGLVGLFLAGFAWLTVTLAHQTVISQYCRYAAWTGFGVACWGAVELIRTGL